MVVKPLVQLAGTVSLSDEVRKVFYFKAQEQLGNFGEWEYLKKASRTEIPICAAVDYRKFTANLPPAGSHVLVRGTMDEYTRDSTNYMARLWVLVDSFEVLCGSTPTVIRGQEVHPHPAPPSTLSSSVQVKGNR